MKVLELIEILKQYQQVDKAVGGDISEHVRKTIKELEEIANMINNDQTIKDKLKVVFMENGVVVEEGPSKEFFANPREERTRTFLQNIEQHYE